MLYRELAEALASTVSVYGLQSQGLDHRSQRLTRIEEMAAHYVEEIQGFQSRGPYHLGGYCMGGAVAYEMARQLRQKGEEVGLVVLFDSYNLSTVKGPTDGVNHVSSWRQKIGFHLANLLQIGPRHLPSYFFEKFRMAREAALASGERQLRRTRSILDGSQSAEVVIQKVNDDAVWRYVPQPFDGRLIIFRPQKNYDFMPDPHLGWGELVEGRIDLIQLPVNPHAMLIRPWVNTLAAELKRRLL